MSIEALKEQARRHEHREEWRKALDQYKKAIAKLDAEDQPDIGLYNRVGDLFVRVGNLDEAVKHYERAVDLYMEAELPNNAIAVLKKVIRHVPQRHQALLKMGQVRAAQGFLPDARASFLTYAERMQQAGDIDESLRALVEFCDLAPDDVALRQAVADQMASHERVGDAVEQLIVAYNHLMLQGDVDEAAALEARINELDPELELKTAPTEEGVDFLGAYGQVELGDEEGSAIPAGHEDGGGTWGGEDEEAATTVTEEPGDVSWAGDEEAATPSTEEPGDEEAATTVTEEPGDVSWAGDEEAATTVTEEPGDVSWAGDEERDTAWEAEEESEELTFVEAASDDVDWGEEDEDGQELPFLDLGPDEDEAGDEVAWNELPDDGGAEDATVAEPPTEEMPELLEAEAKPEEVEAEPEPEEVGAPAGEAVEAAIEDARFERAAAEPASLDDLRARAAERPDDVSLHQRLVEVAYREGDETLLAEAYMGLGEALQRGGLDAQAKAAFQQVLEIDPGHEGARAALGTASTATPPVKEVAAHEDYVDLGSLILGDEDEKTTRFVVAYEEPSGDEAADFAKMLAQFKEKVSQNLDADDVKAHHDLGTAYMEMGLLDEAVSEFQQALRASADHLATYELLGQAFMAMGRYDAAVRSLKRALEVPSDVEDDLVGIYYYLARAYEETGNKESALEFYDRVFSLDINFADVTERLKALR